jgi:hypothetical protein
MKLSCAAIFAVLMLGCGQSDAPISNAAEYEGEYTVIVEPGAADDRPPLIHATMNSGQKLHLSIGKDGKYKVTQILDKKLKDTGILVKRGEGFGFKSDGEMDVPEEVISFTVISECVMTKVSEGRYKWMASTSDILTIVKDK